MFKILLFKRHFAHTNEISIGPAIPIAHHRKSTRFTIQQMKGFIKKNA